MNVCLRFIGGPLDGEIRFDDTSPMPTDDPTALQMRSFYELTQGEVGKATMGLSPAALGVLQTSGAKTLSKTGARGYKYRVVERHEEGDVTYILAEVTS